MTFDTKLSLENRKKRTGCDWRMEDCVMIGRFDIGDEVTATVEVSNPTMMQSMCLSTLGMSPNDIQYLTASLISADVRKTREAFREVPWHVLVA